MSDTQTRSSAIQPRRLKACRTCRRQKMRCEGSPETPCPRCVNAGVQCIFDLAERREQPDSGSSGSQKRKLDAMQQELQTLRNQVHGILNSHNAQSSRQESRRSPLPDSVRVDRAETDMLRRSTPLALQSGAPEDQQAWHYRDSMFSDRAQSRPAYVDISSSSGNLDRLNQVHTGPPAVLLSSPNYIDHLPMDAPISAAQALTPPVSADLQSIEGRSRRVIDGDVPASTTDAQPAGICGPPTISHTNQDYISCVFKDEIQARNLLALFYAGANPFIPILDPVVDTFDSLRLRSPFCLITIMYIALSQRHGTIAGPAGERQVALRDLALKEARRLATESLFEKPATLEAVQAMVLLAAYSRKVWFAIGHALQMAVDLGLDRAVDRLHGQTQGNSPEAYRLLREARTWLVLHHLDRELAFGTARPPRMQLITTDLLRKYLSHPITTSSDMRYVSIIEITRLRGELLSGIEHQSFDSTSALTWIESFLQRIENWYLYWDAQLEGRGIDGCSFQRTSLWIQKAFARINFSCVMLQKLRHATTESLRLDMNELMRRTASVTMQLLRFIAKSASYRWHFNWAPAYSALMLTFLAMFALQVSRRSPQLIDRFALTQDLNPVLQMLEGYSYIDNIAGQLREMIVQSSQGPTVLDESNCAGLVNQEVRGASNAEEQGLHAAENNFFDFEDVDYFLTMGYLDNWPYFEHGDQDISSL